MGNGAIGPNSIGRLNQSLAGVGIGRKSSDRRKSAPVSSKLHAIGRWRIEFDPYLWDETHLEDVAYVTFFG